MNAPGWTRSARGRLSVGVLLPMLGALLLAPAASAASGPNLTVIAVKTAATKALILSRFTVTDTTRNRGRGRSPASATVFFLSSDRKPSLADLPAGTGRVRALGAGRSNTSRARLTVPVLAAGGTWYVLACAGAVGHPPTSTGAGHCRAGARKLNVPPGPIPRRGYFPRPSHPRTVTPALDGSAATSGLISAASGGTLTATGRNGARYTLAVPAGALASDETITMTPVSSLTGSPLGALIGAVDLAPNGLQLLKPATLTIVPPSPVKPAEVAGFEAFEGGHDFGLNPLNRGGGIAMSLQHFSEEGAAEATAAEIRVALLLMPSRPQADWQQIAAAALRTRSFDPDALAVVAVAYYRDVVAPLVAKASTDDTYADSAVAELAGWLRSVGTIGLDGNRYVASLVQSSSVILARILRNAVAQRYQRCVGSNDLSEITRLLAAERMAAILNVDLGVLAGLGEKCAHFELDVTTTAERVFNTGDQVFTGDIGVEDDVPIDVTALAGQYTGTANPTYTNWQYRVKCGSGTAAAGTAVASPSKADFSLDYNIYEQPNPKTGQVVRTVSEPTLRLRFVPGDTREMWTSGGGSSSPYLTLWDDVWRDGHATELVPNQLIDVYELDDWQTFPPGSGPLVAMKTYPTRTYCHNTVPGCVPSYDAITETTMLKLYHRPQR
jgi:hypothetical protein